MWIPAAVPTPSAQDAFENFSRLQVHRLNTKTELRQIPTQSANLPPACWRIRPGSAAAIHLWKRGRKFMAAARDSPQVGRRVHAVGIMECTPFMLFDVWRLLPMHARAHTRVVRGRGCNDRRRYFYLHLRRKPPTTTWGLILNKYLSERCSGRSLEMKGNLMKCTPRAPTPTAMGNSAE